MQKIANHMGKKLLITGCLISLLFTSCKKYLDEKADKQLTQLKTLSDLQGLLDDYATMNFATTPGFGETSADDYFLRLSDYTSRTDDSRAAYTWSSYDYPFVNDWSISYKGVYSANYCLDYVEKIQRTSQNQNDWNNVKGSALFYRSYIFLNLVWVYGKAFDDNASKTDLGIVLRVSADPTIKSVRSSVNDCYSKVIEDAKTASQILPDLPQHVMRPSKAAAYGLLARAYLSMRKYDSAFKYANLCLGKKNDLLNYNDPSINQVANLSFPLFNTEIIFYTTQSPNYNAKNPLSKALVDSTLFSFYDNNDLRKKIFFRAKNGYNFFKGTYSRVANYDLFTGIATDEMLLTRAECYARLNKTDEAMNDLNTLLVNRWKTGTFVPLTASSSQQALSLILTERRKELIYRGLRWIDIKRLNMEGANIVLKRVEDQVYILQPNSDKYALPLPKDIIQLTGMIQNPGW